MWTLTSFCPLVHRLFFSLAPFCSEREKIKEHTVPAEREGSRGPINHPNWGMSYGVLQMMKDSKCSINLIRVSESVPTQYKGEAKHVILNDHAMCKQYCLLVTQITHTSTILQRVLRSHFLWGFLKGLCKHIFYPPGATVWLMDHKSYLKVVLCYFGLGFYVYSTYLFPIVHKACYSKADAPCQ